ncbi:MAG: membrane dipeptidase [Oscillospiraceae bacterium]|nr:membrane dipeptidase [Oscillospiraceae bacterium]
MNIPVFDLHCDTVTKLLGRDLSASISLRSNQLHIDLERMKSYPGYAQCFGFWSTTGLPLPKGLKAEDIFWREVSVLQDQIDKNSDLIRQARNGEDLRKNLAGDFISAIFTLEGPACIGFDPAKLEKLHKLGFRISTLGWNENNSLTGSHVTGGGLTKRGREYVKECQRLGILVDVSHISDEGFWQIIEMTEAPVIATHSNSRKVCADSRNLTDEMFRAICSTGGVAGFNMCADFVGAKPTLDTACDHIFHFLELDPAGTHIAIGGDLDGISEMPEGFHGVQDFGKLAKRLLERGLDELTLKQIFWSNALGVIDKCSM